MTWGMVLFRYDPKPNRQSEAWWVKVVELPAKVIINNNISEVGLK